MKAEKDIKVLRDQLTICKQELNVLGKRNIVLEPEQAARIEEAVHREIKRRRKNSVGPAEPVTLSERRAIDKEAAS